jgi:hypothetical protein
MTPQPQIEEGLLARHPGLPSFVPKELQRESRKASTDKANASTSKVSFATRESSIELKDDARSLLGSVAKDSKVSQLGPIATQDAASLSGGSGKVNWSVNRPVAHVPQVEGVEKDKSPRQFGSLARADSNHMIEVAGGSLSQALCSSPLVLAIIWYDMSNTDFVRCGILAVNCPLNCPRVNLNCPLNCRTIQTRDKIPGTIEGTIQTRDKIPFPGTIQGTRDNSGDKGQFKKRLNLGSRDKTGTIHFGDLLIVRKTNLSSRMTSKRHIGDILPSVPEIKHIFEFPIKIP